VVRGYLKNTVVFGFPQEWSHLPIDGRTNSFSLAISQIGVGFLCSGIVFELKGVLFMPLIGNIFKKRSFFLDDWDIEGSNLALILKGNYCERVVLFSFFFTPSV